MLLAVERVTRTVASGSGKPTTLLDFKVENAVFLILLLHAYVEYVSLVFHPANLRVVFLV